VGEIAAPAAGVKQAGTKAEFGTCRLDDQAKLRIAK
jgi:hypothetical protein